MKTKSASQVVFLNEILFVLQQLVSAKDASLTHEFNTEGWEISGAGEQMAGQIPPLPAGFGEPGVSA